MQSNSFARKRSSFGANTSFTEQTSLGLEEASAYSRQSNTTANGKQVEISIDIHVRHVRLKVLEKTPIRIMW